MSYCRFCEPCGRGRTSDVYMFGHELGGIECCGCVLHDGGSVIMFSARAAVAHLKMHVAAGHNVPGRAMRGLIGIRKAEADFAKESREKFGVVFSDKWEKSEPARKRHAERWRKKIDRMMKKAQEDEP